MPQQILMWVMVGVIFVLLVAWWVYSSKKNKKKEQEAKDLINAVKPGNKVKTIGGVCGIVVEVDDEENTFVLETGSVTAGKSYVKFDRQAIWQTDAVVEKKDKDAKPAEEPSEEQAAEPSQEAEISEAAETPEEKVSENNVSENK